MYNARTDLAVESREMHMKNEAVADEIKGVEAESETFDCGIEVTRVIITDEDGEEALGKPKGRYITVELPDNGQVQQETYEEACRICAKELGPLLKKDSTGTVLVVGLGNRNITADAVGPKCMDSVLVTRHLLEYMPEEIDKRLRSVCAVSPGVLGITGIETAEMVKGLVEKVKPSLIIAVDALCSRRMERVNSTIQISDTGITPGAGIGNRRMAIDEETLGVPVIAIGVPTVVDAATLAADLLDKPEPPDLGTGKDFLVTPKDIDSQVKDLSKVIGYGINLALQPGLTIEDLDLLLS